jgi:uncharacterized protein YdhG (YjbR/CyaY superfamily)
MRQKTSSHDDYLSNIDEPQHTIMERLRTIIKSTCPEAEEGMSFWMPTFTYKGRLLVWYRVSKERCTFYPWTNSIAVRLKDELQNHTITRGNIRFTHTKPLPPALIKKIVKIKMEETLGKNDMKTTREWKMLTHHYADMD